MKNLLTHIYNAQGLYPRLFADQTNTDWGSLFYNPRNTLSVEANHGVILNEQDDYVQPLRECVEFYTQRNIPPRMYFYLPLGCLSKVESAAQQVGGTLSVSPLKLLTCRNPKEKTVHTPLTFVALKEWDPQINEHIIGENLHLEGLLRGSMAHDTYTLTVGYLFGTPVTMASLWDDGEVMRISNVMTGEGFRGCGFAGALILHLLSLAAQKQKPAYLFADNPVAIRVYERDGMQVEDSPIGLFLFEKE